MLPIIPHFAHECINEIDQENFYKWPTTNPDVAVNKSYNIVIQINGKKRGLIDFDYDVGEKELIQKIKENDIINKFIQNKEIKKSIYIKNKLINLII